MAKLTTGELASALLQIGEAVVAIVRESGVLKPPRKKRVVRRKRKAKGERKVGRPRKQSVTIPDTDHDE